MGYNIVKITSYYKDFLSYYYSRYPEIQQNSYEKQHYHLMQQRFAWSDAYALAFQSLGHNATEIVGNASPLQLQWAKEHDLSKTDEEDILIEQLRDLKPEIVWLQDSYTYNGAFILKIKKEIPSIKLTIGNCCSPISPKYYEDFKAFDFITVCAPYFKQLLEKKGLPECLIIPHAFDGRILTETTPKMAQKHDFLFTGSIILDQNFHKERITLLETLIKDGIDINLLVNLNENSSKGLRVKQLAFIASKSLDKIGLNTINQQIKGLNKINKLQYFPTSSKVSKALKSKIKEPVFGMEMFTEMAQSKIAFNIHGDIASNFAANMRMYEATGMGTCLLTDWKPDINNYFIDGEEVLTYRSFDEAKEKIDYILKHPEELNEIAKKGQQKTLSEHTFDKRAKMIDYKIRELL